VGDRDSGVIESRSMRADVRPVRVHLSSRSCKGHLSIRQIRITVVGNERVGEGSALWNLCGSTGIGVLVAVITVMGWCRGMGSGVRLAEMEEQI